MKLKISILVILTIFISLTSCSKKEDSKTFSTIQITDYQETLYWVLRFGSAVTVLNPPELVEQYKSEVRKMSKKISSS